MQQHYKQLYLMATRHDSILNNKGINNFSPRKENNQIFNCETLLDTKRCVKEVKEVKLTIELQKVSKDENKNARRNLMLVEMLTAEKKGNKKKIKNRGKSLQSFSGITVIKSDKQHKHTNNQKQKKLFNYHSLSSNVQQSKLDIYIDQYLKQIVNEGHSSLRQELQADRKGFIQKAIKQIKMRIGEGNEGGDEKDGKAKREENGNFGRQNKQMQIQWNNKRNKNQFILNESLQKLKHKSTHQTIALNQQKILPTIPITPHKFQAITCPLLTPRRSIYNSASPSSEFIQKVGETFYTKEMKVLERIKGLQQKNRLRANHSFRRRLMSLEKSLGSERSVRGLCGYE